MSRANNDNKPCVIPLVLAHEAWALPYLSIGMIAAQLRAYAGGKLNASFNIEAVQLGGIADYPLAAIVAEVSQKTKPFILLSSYVWNHAVNLQAAKEFKACNSESTIIIGGPEIPKYFGETEAFLENHPYIDIAVLGEGEISCAEILSASTGGFDEEALRLVDGIVYQLDGKRIRTAERTRLRQLNELPSPYLSGEFEPWFRSFTNTILETNRGCPYGCTYCDWGSATLQKVSKFSVERVEDEINYLAECKSETIFIADANFGMLEQDITIAESLVRAKKKHGFPKRIYTNFAKNGGRRLMEVIKVLHQGGLLPVGIVALQTTDAETLKTIKRDNIKTSAYEKMMEYFNEQNIPMASDIMIGLPGQTIDSLQVDLQFCFDWKVSANGNYTSLMPNAPMAEASYRSRYLIATDDAGLVESTASFTKEDMGYMKALFTAYQFFVCLGVLKYFLYYIQLEHGIKAMDFVRCWLDRVIAKDQSLALSIRIYEELFEMENRKGDWALLSWGDNAEFLFQSTADFYDEILCFLEREFGALDSSDDVASLFDAQSIVMPRLNRQYPHGKTLSKDVVAYFEQYKTIANVQGLRACLKPLGSYSEGELVARPVIKEKKSLVFVKRETHADDWELPSDLRFY